MKRLLCIVLAFLLLLSAAACSSKEENTTDSESGSATELPESTDEYTETEPYGQTDITVTESTEVPVQNTGKVTSTAPATTAAPTKPVKPTQSALTEKDEIIALYNAALPNSANLKQTSYKRELFYCHTTVLRQDVDLIDMFPKVIDVAAQDDTNEAPHNLVKLDSGMVNSAVQTGKSGDTATYDIRLHPASATETMSQGHGGYPGLVLTPEVTRLIGEVTAEIGFPGVKVKDDIQYKLTDGKIIIKIDTAKKQILSADVTYIQSGSATASFAAFNAYTNLSVNQAYTYQS